MREIPHARCELPKEKFLSLLLVLLLAGGLAGCGSRPVALPPEPVAQAPAPVEENLDQAKLQEALTGQQLSQAQVADLSDRLLASGNEVSDQDMARLELLLLKAIKSPDKTHHASLWRNLGIIHFSQRKYKQARQELQASNELNPKNGRTHYYLARLSVYQGQIYERQGQKHKARQQFKRASIEMELARKFEPNNPQYRQDIKKLIGQE